MPGRGEVEGIEGEGPAKLVLSITIKEAGNDHKNFKENRKNR